MGFGGSLAEPCADRVEERLSMGDPPVLGRFAGDCARAGAADPGGGRFLIKGRELSVSEAVTDDDFEVVRCMEAA